MSTGSTEILAQLAAHPDNYLLDEFGVPYSKTPKRRTVTLVTKEGEAIIQGDAGALFLGDLLRSHLVYEAGFLGENHRRIYKLTPDGLRLANN